MKSNLYQHTVEGGIIKAGKLTSSTFSFSLLSSSIYRCAKSLNEKNKTKKEDSLGSKKDRKNLVVR